MDAPANGNTSDDVVPTLHDLGDRLATVEHQLAQLLQLAGQLTTAVERVASLVEDVRAGGLAAILRGRK